MTQTGLDKVKYVYVYVYVIDIDIGHWILKMFGQSRYIWAICYKYNPGRVKWEKFILLPENNPGGKVKYIFASF